MAKAKEAAAPAAKVTKETKAPAADKGAQLAAARAARDSAAKNDRFVFVKDVPEAKMAPQAKVIVELVKGHGKDGVSRENLCKEMEGKVTTRQPQSRILTYYTKLITTETGICRLDKAAPAPAAVKQAAAVAA